MENISSLLNSSDSSGVNNSLIREFPYWQPTLAVALLLNTIMLFGIILVLYLPLLIEFVIIMKKEQLKALNLLHVSLLIVSSLNNILRVCLFYIHLPSAFRYCICYRLTSAIVIADITFFAVYRPLTHACLSVLQFLTIIGKKKFVNLKVACGMVALCSAVSFICIMTSGRQVYLADWRPVCGVSFCPDSGPTTAFVVRDIAILSVSLIIFPPTLGVVIIISTWSCAIFKKYYTGGDDQLNRRMLSLPFIMPIVIIVSAAFEPLLTRLVASFILMLSLGDLFPYWIIFANSIMLTVSHSSIGLVYPSVLLYTHTPLRQAVKRLLLRFKRPNRVNPATS